MLLSDILHGIPHQVCGDVDLNNIAIGRIVYDSRKASAGCLFFCLVGGSMDGHSYAVHAYENGCRAFVCSREVSLPDDVVMITVSDTRRALASASANFFGHPADALTIIGITGTKGKTTTALLVNAILNEAHLPCGYIGTVGVMYAGHEEETLNSTPESYEMHRWFAAFVQAGIRYVVLEVSSQGIKNDRIYGISFDIAVFLNLSHDHISPLEHPDFDDYKRCKKRLLTDYHANIVLVNTDDPYTAEMTQGVTALISSFGITAPADISASNIRLFRGGGVIGVEFACAVNGEDAGHVRMRCPGDFSVYNGLAALSICLRLGVNVRFAADVMERTSVRGRFELVDTLPYCTMVIDYAHNEISLSRVLDVLRKYHPHRLICIFGSVGGRTQMRRPELGRVASELADFCIVTSDNPNYEDPTAIIRDIVAGFTRNCPHLCIENREMAIRDAVRMAEEGDILLFAGKGHETYQLVNGRKLPFSERAIIEREAQKLLEAHILH